MIEFLPQMPALAVALAGVFGLIIGSFLNVVILRVPARMEWQWRRDCRETLELPPGDEPVKCLPVKTEDGWLSDADLKAPTHKPAPWADYTGDRATARG